MPNWKKVLLNGNDGSLSTLSLTGLSAQNSETDVLTINGSNVVGTRQLGSNAFTSTTIPTNNNQLSNGAGYLTSVGTINLASGVTGTLPVGNGGTGLTSLTATYIPYGNGTSAFGSNAALAFNETNKQLILTGINSAGNSPLSLVSLQTGAESDVTALFIDSSDHVVKKGLGTLAFENSLTFASLTSKPTTIAGYGITDSLQIGTTSTTALAGNTTVGTVVTGNGGGSGDTLSQISIGGTTFTVTTGTGNGTVDTSGTPVDNDFAKFTDGNTIEGRSISETKSDLSLNNVENTALSTYTGNGGALDNQYIANNAGYTTNTGTLTGNGTSTRVPFYNGTTSFTTNAAFVYTDASKRLDLTGIASSGNSPLRLSNLQEDDTESSKALFLASDDDIMWRTLGNNAFNSTTIPTNTNQLTNGSGFLTSLSGAVLTTGAQTVAGAKTFSSDIITTAGFDGGVRIGGWPNDPTGYSFIGTTDMTGYEYMMISDGTNTFVGAGSGGSLYLRGPANDSSPQIEIDGSLCKVDTGDFKVEDGSIAVGTITNSTTNGRIDASNDVVAFSTSDERLKKYIKNIKNPLEKISKINGVTFEWKKTDDKMKKEVHSFEGNDVGVIAQEVEKVLPEVVTTRDNGYKAVKYEKIIPLLVESIKELKAEIEELKKSK